MIIMQRDFRYASWSLFVAELVYNIIAFITLLLLCFEHQLVFAGDIGIDTLPPVQCPNAGHDYAGMRSCLVLQWTRQEFCDGMGHC